MIWLLEHAHILLRALAWLTSWGVLMGILIIDLLDPSRPRTKWPTYKPRYASPVHRIRRP